MISRTLAARDIVGDRNRYPFQNCKIMHSNGIIVTIGKTRILAGK